MCSLDDQVIAGARGETELAINQEDFQFQPCFHDDLPRQASLSQSLLPDGEYGVVIYLTGLLSR